MILRIWQNDLVTKLTAPNNQNLKQQPAISMEIILNLNGGGY